jgi:excisionase family DNA binding protein
MAARQRNIEAEPLLTPGEVADLFKVHPLTVTRWAVQGRIGSVRTLGGHQVQGGGDAAPAARKQPKTRPASAASGQITQFRFSGTFAEALWYSSTATSVTDTVVTVSTSNQGSELSVVEVTEELDANGNFAGASRTSSDVTSGFSLTVGQSLASASLGGSALRAMFCLWPRISPWSSAPTRPSM